MTPKSPLDEAVIIAGGGFIGPLMALSLARMHTSVYLIDPAPLSHQLNTPSDGRAIAITQASKTFFEELDLWQFLLPHAEPLLTVFTQDNSGTEMRLGTEHTFHQPFGYMVDSKILRDTLAKEAHKNPHITCLVDQVHGVQYEGAFDASVGVTLASGDHIFASLLIGADGARSRIRRASNLRTYEWCYDQTAFVRVYHHSTPHHGQAYEKFLSSGPFAILPLPHNRSSIVWTVTNEKAAELRALSENAFDQAAFAHMAGYQDLTPCSPLWERPLKGLWVPFFTAHRVALIGDAAHLIHPLAGQGFNVGIQDVACLTKTLEDALSLGFDMGSHTVLKRYEQAQRGQHLALLGVTHGLNGLFSNDEKILKWIRNRGLAFIEKNPALKEFFAQQGAGIQKPIRAAEKTVLSPPS